MIVKPSYKHIGAWAGTSTSGYNQGGAMEHNIFLKPYEPREWNSKVENESIKIHFCNFHVLRLSKKNFRKIHP